MKTSLLCVAILLGAVSATWTDTFTLSTTKACGGDVGTVSQKVDDGHGGDVVTIEQRFKFGPLSDHQSYAGKTDAATISVSLSCDASGPTADLIQMTLNSCSPLDSHQCETLVAYDVYKFTADDWANLGKGGVCVPVQVHSSVREWFQSLG